MSHDLSAGDVVELKSGGLAMTIASIDSEGAVCVWFKDSEMKKEYIQLAALTRRGSLPPRTGKPFSEMLNDPV